MEEVLLYFSLKYEGDFLKIFKALQRKERVDEKVYVELLSQMDCQYTTIVSEDYPECLKNIDCPPFVLFYHGDLSLLNKACISIIGKRHPSEYGTRVTKGIVKDLSKHQFVVVSGMAIGIDSIAHRSAIDNGMKTVAVLGSGIEYIYPKRHASLYKELCENHLVISEYPYKMQPSKKTFPKRNRLISGLGERLIVTEADIQSGSMITVNFALEQGKEVYAVPSRLEDAQGCNKLIQQGAHCFLSVDDILEDI